MKTIVLILQIIFSIILVGVVLIQSQGSGLGRAFGGGGVSFSKRGLEGLIFKFTFVIAALFIVISIVDIAV